MSELSLPLALERYDRHVPLFMGSVKAPAGLSLRVLEVGMSPPRYGFGQATFAGLACNGQDAS